MQKLKNQKGFTPVEVILSVLLIAVIGAAGYFAYQAHTKATGVSSNQPGTKSSPKTVTFEVNDPGLVGPACVYPTTIGSQKVCFEPTESQESEMGTVRTQGYLTVQIQASAYTDSEVLHGSAVNSPGENTTVLRAVKMYSVTGIGPQYPSQE